MLGLAYLIVLRTQITKLRNIWRHCIFITAFIFDTRLLKFTKLSIRIWL